MNDPQIVKSWINRQIQVLRTKLSIDLNAIKNAIACAGVSSEKSITQISPEKVRSQNLSVFRQQGIKVTLQETYRNAIIEGEERGGNNEVTEIIIEQTKNK